MTAKDALSHYFVEQGLFPEGSSVEDWLEERWPECSMALCGFVALLRMMRIYFAALIN